MGKFELLIAFALVAFSIYKYLETKRFLNGAQFAKANVVKVEKTDHLADIDNAEEYQSYRYTLVFEIPSGEQIEFVSGVEDTEPMFAVGQDTQIVYQPSDPTNARLASFWSLYFPSILAGIVALVVLALPFFKQVL